MHNPLALLVSLVYLTKAFLLMLIAGELKQVAFPWNIPPTCKAAIHHTDIGLISLTSSGPFLILIINSFCSPVQYTRGGLF